MLFLLALCVALNAVLAATERTNNSVAQLFGDRVSSNLVGFLDPLLLGKRQRNEDENGALLCDENTVCSDSSCCGTNGKCGYGPTFCGKGNCTSNCDALAMCGQYGDKDLNGGKCGMNLCCSASGWCGTSDAHCTGITGSLCQSDYGPCQKQSPTKCGVGSGSTNGRTVGYYQGSNTYARVCNKIAPNDIDTTKYTHLNFAFASINPSTFYVEPANSQDIPLYKEFTALKSKGVKTWIAVGGFDFSDPDTSTHTTWSDLVASPDHRATFIKSLGMFMDDYGFDGVDIDWEYPVAETRGGTKKDTQNLVLLVQEMRAAFGAARGISLALAPDYWYLRYFDAKAMEPYVDWFGFMTYDLHGFWDGENANIGSTVRGQAGIDEIQNNTAPLYFDQLNFNKINFGLANYGRGYTLGSRSCLDLGCPFTGPSKPALCTDTKGVMSLTEIESLIAEKNLTPKLLDAQKMKSIQWADQWIGYDDAETFALKKAWADDYCFGGTMTWSVDFHSGVGSGSDVPVTTDGSCGPEAKMRCGTDSNKCCSSGGWCGDSEDHCSSGCQSLFGECTTGGNTTDGTCGISNNDLQCGGFLEGPCCSASGYCGWSAAHCALSGVNDLDGCQSGCDSWNAQIKLGIKDPVNPNMGEDTTCEQVKGPRDLTKEFFQQLKVKDWFAKWFNPNPNGGMWLSELGRPLGLQRSLQACSVNDPCKTPNCADMDDENIPGSGWKYMVIVSAVNLNTFFANLFDSINEAATKFSLTDTSLTDDFFFSVDQDVYMETIGLTGLAAALATIFSLGNPVAAATGAALSGVVYEGIVVAQNQPKLSFSDKQKVFQDIADKFISSAKEALTNANLALIQADGTWTPKDSKLTTALDWLGEGDWVDVTQIPMVNNDQKSTVTAGGKMFYSFLGAMVVNWAWHMQGVYIGCYTMSEDDFNKITNLDEKLRVYYNGRGCYFQSAVPMPRSDMFNLVPQGYDKFGDHGFDFSPADILKSSVDSYKAHGFAGDASKDTKFYESLLDSKNGGVITDAFSAAGVFNLPICELDKHFSDAKSFGDHVKNGNSGTSKYDLWCYCFSDQDANAKKITDYLQLDGLYKEFCGQIPDDPDDNPGPIGV